ncbi:MAG: tyrosine-type recombinase/integrase, partial [Opitutales bacterium]
SAYDTKAWIYRFTLDGKPRQMGLGPLHTVTLAEAREVARECRKQLREGIDPIERRNALKATRRLEGAQFMTFRDCAEAYIRTHGAAWRNVKHASQWRNTLTTYAYPFFGDLSVQAVDTALVMKALEPIWAKKPETASRVRGRIEAILDWATAREFRQGENPARWRGHLNKLLPARSKVRKVVHHAALPYSEMGTFMADLRRREAVAARGLEFLILTATRTGEVIGATWDEIDFAEEVWVIPGDRMKSDKEHRISLSPGAIEVLKDMRDVRQSDHVFPGNRTKSPLSNMAFLQLLKRMDRGDLTAHGFRSSFRDWAAERTNYPSEVAEMALAHAVGDKVEAAYRRGDLFDKRRKMMDAWADYCGTVHEVGADTVVPIKGAG